MKSAVHDSLAVVNASPLIFLSRGGHFDLLQSIAATVLVPEIVVREISVRGRLDPTVKCLHRSTWLTIVNDVSVPPSILSWGLGAGESAVLAYAMSQKCCQALIDDLAGRRCASALNIPVMGTLGIVLRAKRKGLLTAARPVLEDMLRTDKVPVPIHTMLHSA